MSEALHIIRREFIYIWYYFDLQLRQIFRYWVLGMAIGSLISVFAKDKIHRLFAGLQGKKLGLLGIIPACLLGIASPLCMYGTVPIAASFRKQGMREDWLAAFMMASILLNPQLIIYSAALGRSALAVRIVSCFLCGCTAGILVFLFYRDKEFFDFEGFEVRASRDTHPNLLVRYLLNFWRNIKATGPYFLIGILASSDPVALDQASVDLVYQAEDGEALVKRIESRNGIHTLEHAEEIGLGSRTYEMVNIDE